MRRRTLWGLVIVACAAIVAVGTPANRQALLDWWRPTVDWWLATAPTLLPTAELRMSAMWAGISAAAILGVFALSRRLRDRHARVQRLVARGRPVATVARRTRLSQDAVRDLAAGAFAARQGESAGRAGSFFRPRAAAPAAAGGDFAAVLARSTARATS